jgi:hypothetical protein
MNAGGDQVEELLTEHPNAALCWRDQTDQRGDRGLGVVELKTGLRIFTSWHSLDHAVAAILLWRPPPASKMNSGPAY